MKFETGFQQRGNRNPASSLIHRWISQAGDSHPRPTLWSARENQQPQRERAVITTCKSIDRGARIRGKESRRAGRRPRDRAASPPRSSRSRSLAVCLRVDPLARLPRDPTPKGWRNPHASLQPLSSCRVKGKILTRDRDPYRLLFSPSKPPRKTNRRFPPFLSRSPVVTFV